jgi:glc operon protein GlcG
MHLRHSLSSSDVDAVLSAALAHARAHAWRVTVAVVDEGGHLLGLKRDDGASPASAHIAPGKARTAALGQRESKFYEDMLTQGRLAFITAPGIDCLLEGGVPIFIDGQCVGAVGVSGVKSHEDADIARAGIQALSDALSEN